MMLFDDNSIGATISAIKIDRKRYSGEKKNLNSDSQCRQRYITQNQKLRKPKQKLHNTVFEVTKNYVTQLNKWGNAFIIHENRYIYFYNSISRKVNMWVTIKINQDAKSIFQINCNVNSKYPIASLFSENRLSPLAYKH